MDAARLPIAVLDTDLRLIYRNPASETDPVFASLDPGQSLGHTGLRAAGPLRERTDARHEFVEACALGGGPQCLSETRRVGGMDRLIFWICVCTRSEAGDLLLVIGLGDAWTRSRGNETVQTEALSRDLRLPLAVISGEADSLADLLEEPLSGRAASIGRTARLMLYRVDRATTFRNTVKDHDRRS